MARGRREARATVDIWPGFVDALSTLLLAVIFMLVVFVLGQFFLGQLLQGRDETAARQARELGRLSSDLDGERSVAAELRRSLAQLSADLQVALGDRDDLGSRLARLDGERATLADRLARADGQRLALERSIDEQRLASSDAQAAVLASRRELDAARELVRADRSTIEAQLADLVRLRREVDSLGRLKGELEQDLAARGVRADELQQRLDAEALAKLDAQGQMQRLQRQVEALSTQLRTLDAALQLRQGEIDKQSTTIADLGRRLNMALASKVEELTRSRSDFFGKIRAILGERSDVRVVGDRFVFQSEVLFRAGEAELGPEGRAQLAKLAQAFKEIIGGIPADLPWVLQVDGHTDRRPIATARFPSNWELSTARAISVARFLIDQAIPADRVAARGFAEFAPLDEAESEEAFRRNRRIEIKLTTR